MGPSNDRVMIERSKAGVVSNSCAASLINVVDAERRGIESMGASSLFGPLAQRADEPQISVIVG